MPYDLIVTWQQFTDFGVHYSILRRVRKNSTIRILQIQRTENCFNLNAIKYK